MYTLLYQTASVCNGCVSPKLIDRSFNTLQQQVTAFWCSYKFCFYISNACKNNPVFSSMISWETHRMVILSYARSIAQWGWWNTSAGTRWIKLQFGKFLVYILYCRVNLSDPRLCMYSGGTKSSFSTFPTLKFIKTNEPVMDSRQPQSNILHFLY